MRRRFEKIRRVIQAGRGIELFVGKAETEFLNEVARGGVGGMVAGKETFCAKIIEGKFYDGARRLFGEALTPAGAEQMNAQFENAVLRGGPETSASGVFV